MFYSVFVSNSSIKKKDVFRGMLLPVENMHSLVLVPAYRYEQKRVKMQLCVTIISSNFVVKTKTNMF